MCMCLAKVLPGVIREKETYVFEEAGWRGGLVYTSVIIPRVHRPRPRIKAAAGPPGAL